MAAAALPLPRPRTFLALSVGAVLLIVAFLRVQPPADRSPEDGFGNLARASSGGRGGSGSSGAPVVPARHDDSRTASAAKTATETPVHLPVASRPDFERALAYTITLEGDGIYGTGFVIDPSRGLAVTAWHVVSDMKSPRATFHDGKVVTARLLASDKKLDLALLSVPPMKLPRPAIGDATRLRPGEEVYAIGAPRKLAFTISRGIVSYVGRTMEGARYLQADMSINDGNSGGPVITASGEIVGMMSFIYRRAQGLSFALPVNYVIDRFADRLTTIDEADAQARRDYLDRFSDWKTAK